MGVRPLLLSVLLTPYLDANVSLHVLQAVIYFHLMEELLQTAFLYPNLAANVFRRALMENMPSLENANLAMQIV